VVLNGGLIPPGGLDNFNSGYLPATYQGSVFSAGNPPVANIRAPDRSDVLQRNKLALLRRLDAHGTAQAGATDEIEAAIANYEMTYRMQAAVPDLMDLSDESPATLDMYGLNDKFKNTTVYGRICLIARRLVERGVRFIELTCPGGNSWFPTNIIHARKIPGANTVPAVVTGHHRAAHGKLAIIDPSRGRQEARGVQLIAPIRETKPIRVDRYALGGNQFPYPYPLDEPTREDQPEIVARQPFADCLPRLSGVRAGKPPWPSRSSSRIPSSTSHSRSRVVTRRPCPKISGRAASER